MVPFFKTLFANTFQGFIATKEVYLYVHRERHVLPHIPTCYISSVYSFFSFNKIRILHSTYPVALIHCLCAKIMGTIVLSLSWIPC